MNKLLINCIKLWVILIVILTFLYITFLCICSSSININSFDQNKLEYLRSITPAYPPPLVSFMDPPNVFDVSTIT